MKNSINIDSQEVEKFNKLAKIWWDKKGPMGMLHVINPLRMQFINQNIKKIENCKILDIGCGGGILTESLYKKGAKVTGIDLAESSILIAKQHAKKNNLNINYQFKNIDDMVGNDNELFDIITCMEVLEHVPNPQQTIESCSKLLKPGGIIFFSTINRTIKSFLFAIIGAEYILRILPKGTHSYQKLIRPKELEQWGNNHGLNLQRISSLIYNPFMKSFKIKEVIDVNYITCFNKI